MTDTIPVITAELIWQLVPFARHRDVRFSTLQPDRVTAQLPVRSEYAMVGGGVHGGAILALADITAAVTAVLANGTTVCTQRSATRPRSPG